MPEYKEFEPAPHLANAVECFWVSSQESSTERLQRVVPDGCADIIYTRRGSKAGLIFAGVMTHFKDFAQAAGACSVGIRLRPGMWPEVVFAASRDLNDRVVPLEDLWGLRARGLLRALEGAEQWPEFIKLLGQALPTVTSRSPIQQAIEAMERTQGRLALDEAASKAGMGARQFRRRCSETAGLSPKMLARVLRFRAAMKCAPKMDGRHAELAVAAGYADQSHFIAEFKEFAGRTPHVSAEFPDC